MSYVCMSCHMYICHIRISVTPRYKRVKKFETDQKVSDTGQHMCSR